MNKLEKIIPKNCLVLAGGAIRIFIDAFFTLINDLESVEADAVAGESLQAFLNLWQNNLILV